MVAIVAGNGLGLLNTSLNTLDGAGVLGQSVLGQGSSRAVVNAVSGNLVLQMQDEQLAGRGLDLYALRTYNSLGTLNDGDGDGWRWGYEQTVRFQGLGTPAQPQADATVIRTDGDGHETPYTWHAARAAYIGTEGSGAHDELRYEGVPSEWVWTDGSTRVIERYSNSTSSSMTGRLIRRTDTSNNSIVLMYDGARLTLIQDTASQQELRLQYGPVNGVTRLQRLETRALIDDASGRATATLGTALRQVEYNYDSVGRLITITTDLTPADSSMADGVVFVTTYTYDETTARIASVTQSDGTSVCFTYDAAGRVSTVKEQSGAPSTQLVFTYNTATKSTAITDGNGQVWTYRYDATTQQLTEILTPTVGGAALSTRFTYDASGNLVSSTDARNNTVTYDYDSHGNRTLERDALGNTVTRTFSPLNQMLTETRYRIADPDGAGAQSAREPLTTRSVYDAHARLRFVVSAEGRVTEHRYGSESDGYGLLTQTLQYVGDVYDLTGLSPAAELTETQLTAWVAGLPDQTHVQLTEYSYDLRGNMSQQTSYAAVSATGTGFYGRARVTEYIYDAHSQLRRRIDVRGSALHQSTVITSFAYDGMGRVLTSWGANGTQTTVYDDANRHITVTAASGLSETRRYDSRGRLVSVRQTGEATTRQTRYVYNNADQLRMLEDVQGGRRYRFYDAAGRQEYAVDATGAVTRFEYNATGQLVRQTQYLNRADTSRWYDSATQTVTKLGLTVGGASSDVPIDATHDRVTTSAYDAAGRLTTSTDAANTVTTTRYDGVSRVIMTQTGDRVTRSLYDKDHRKVGSVDALGYLTEYKYDAGGRLIETVRYSQRSPAAANMAAPVWIGVTNQNAIAGQPFAYRMPAYDADGDQLTCSVVGTPPSWVSFDAGTATLRGTPPAVVTSYDVTLRADDGRGKTSDVTVLIAVTNSAPSGGQSGAGPTWVSLAPLDVVTNTPVSYVVPAATGPSLTYRVVSGLPPGLAFNASTLTITGSSSAVGFYTTVLRATNTSGQSVDRTVSVQIRTAAPTPGQPAGGDQLSSWRPADTSARHSYIHYDGQGRVVGAVDEQQFLTETVYDDVLPEIEHRYPTERTRRYLTPVTVAPSDTMAALKSRAGASCQTALVQYDDFGRVREVTGLDGSTVTRHEYDEAGRLTRIVSAARTTEERTRRTFYNAYGDVIATLGGEGAAWLGTNPTPERISEAIRDYGMRQEYDTLGRAIRSVDANGNTTLLYYDRENRLTHTLNVIGQSANNTLAGEVSETKYNSFGQVASVRRYVARLADADMEELLAGGGGGFADQSLLSKLAALANTGLDHVSSYEYDRSGRLVEEIDGENGVTVNIYNAHGELAAQVRSHQEGRNTTKQFDYDVNGRVVSQTDDVGGINANTRTAYDAFGRVMQSIDGAGNVTTTAYQDSGRTIVLTDPLNRTTRTEYDALGRVLRVTNALNQQTVYAYNEAARSVTVTTPEQVHVTTARTRHDETLSVTDGRGNVTQYAYNKDGQLTTVTDAWVIANTRYDRSGRKLELTDARGTVTRFSYDQRNRVVERRVDPNGLNLTTLFEFDALGQQITVTEGTNTVAARVTTYAYDRKGRTKTAIVDPAAGGLQLSTNYSFDHLDNTLTVARGTISQPNQHVMLYEFDSLGRRVKEVAAPSSVFGAGARGTRDLTMQYRYDAGGHMSRRIDANRQSTWHVYDAAGQWTHTISALGEVSESTYDAVGRLGYTRRCANRLSPSTVAAFGDAVGHFVPPTASANDQRNYVVYDNDGRARFTLKATGSSGWAINEHRYDANGNVIEVRRYDMFLPDARVAAIDAVSSPGITLPEIQNELSTALHYSDDTPSTLAGVQRTRSAYDANNRLRFTVDPLGSIVESAYDAAGNVVSTIRYAARPTLTAYTESAINAVVNRVHRYDTNNQVTRYAYDAAHRLRYTVDALGSVMEHAYDPRGNVVTTVRWATRPTLTQYSESAIAVALAAVQGTGNDEATRFVYDTSNRLRFTIDALGSVSENMYDALGNVIVTTRFARRPTPGLTSLTESEVNAAVNALRSDGTNQVTRFAYDADTRLRFTVDTLGSVSERVYDALGHVSSIGRFAVRPPLTQYTERAINAAVATERNNPSNQLQHSIYDAVGQVRFSVQKVSVEAGQSKYQVTKHELNALGQTVSSTLYATAVALSTFSEAAIATAVGNGDPSKDRVSRFVYDVAGQQIYGLQAVTLEAGQRTYQVSAHQFDAFGRVVGSTTYATAVALNAFDEAAVDAAVHAVADGTKDRASAVAYDALDQMVYNVRVLSPGVYQVVKQEYDALGRVCKKTQYASAVGPLANFDRATIDAAVNAVAGANDRKVQHVYDAVGRQRFVLQTDSEARWTVNESRYDVLGNRVESRRYDQYVTDAWIVTVDATHASGVTEQEMLEQLSALGYSDSTPSTLVNLQRTRFAYDTQSQLRFTIDALGSITENLYDALGNVVTTVRFAARPALTQYTESAIHAAVNHNDAHNQVQHLAYDASGQLRFNVHVMEPNVGSGGTHRVTEQRYDVLGQLVGNHAYATAVGPLTAYDELTIAAALVPDPVNDRGSAIAYDAGGRQAYTVRALYVERDGGVRGVVTQHVYDALRQLVQRIEYAALVTLTQFDTASIDSAVLPDLSNDRTTTYVHDAAGRLRFEINPDRSFRESVYDALNQVMQTRQFDFMLSSTVPRTEAEMVALRGNRVVGDGVTRGQVHTYDAAGRLTRTVDALTYMERYEYNACGDRTRWIDKNGNGWTCEYDRRGQKTKETAPPVVVQLSHETTPTNRSLQTRLSYDAFGSLVQRIEAAQTVDQRITEYAYDRLGRQIAMVQPGWYDPATGRVEAGSAEGRFQRSLATTYDALGNEVRTTLRTSINSYQYEHKTYDNLGRVVYDVDALSHVTAFAYNAFGEQASVTRYSKSVGTPPLGVDTPWTASALASALGNDPLARTMTMRYDTLGRKTQTMQPTVASYFFSDSFGRFVPLDSSITPVSASGSTTFEYTPFGELCHQTVQLDSTRAQETWRYYDTMGRETRTIVKSSDNIAGEGSPPRPGGGHTARSYDAFGNLTHVIEYAYEGEADNSGNVLTEPPTPDEADSDRISSYVYDARNQQTDTLRSNLRYTALENGQYVQVELGRGHGVNVRHTDYDGVGQVSASTDAMHNVTRSAYNALGQLIQLTEPARVVVTSGLNNPDPFLVDSQVLTAPVTDLVLNPFGQTVKSTRSPGRSDVAGATLITSTSYDFGGNAISTTDARGHVKNWQYDFSGRLVKQTQAISATLGARFAAATQNFDVWQVISHTLERRYAYDAVGHMTDALDVFMDGPTLAQSGQRNIYNAFGEVTEEQIVWGAASDVLRNLQHATRLRNSYDNAGHVVTQDGADGQTQFFYNLMGQMTRAEQRGDNSTADDTHTRVGETGYDLMGRTVSQTKPIFSRTSDMVTPVTHLILDRWSNVIRRTEVGDLGNGLAASIRPTFYAYNADNKVISAGLGYARALRADGSSYTAIVTHQARYDLAGRAVEQIDVARDTSTLPGSVPPSTLRTRSTTYDGIGQVVEEKDAEQLSQGQHGLRYAYDANGNKMATVNAVGNVFVDTFDANGNQLTHNVLRLSPGGENDTYVSGSGNVPVAVLLNSHSYDQANRCIETRDYVSTSRFRLFNGNYVQYDERGFVRGTFQLQETDGSLPYSEDPGRETSYVYDILGNKVQQTDASGHSQAWSYNTATDSGDQPNFTINRLTSAKSTASRSSDSSMPAYGPTGGPGGYEFDEVAPAGMEIDTLIVRYGTDRNVITAFQVVWRTPSGALQHGEPHGSFEVDARQEDIKLGAGEFIVQIQGTYGQFLDSLQVETSSGEVYGPFGGHATNLYSFPPNSEPRQEICGFFGRAAQLIDAIGVHTRPLPVGEFTHTTAYTYTDFGQVKQETYTGTDITDSTAQNNRVYEYKDNGLLAQTKDQQTVGTPGSVGGLDYWSSTSINKYSYTDRGLVATVDIDTPPPSEPGVPPVTCWYEDYVEFGGVIEPKTAQAERRTIGTGYDERDRPVSVINSCFDIQGVSKRSSANVTYDYDELGNRTRITFSSVALSTMPGPGSSTIPGELINGRELWFNYDHEGRMTLAGKTIEQDGTVTDAGVVITYDAAGRRATTLTREGIATRGFTDPETGIYTDTESWDQSRLERYTYNDLGYLTTIEQAGMRSNKLYLGNNTPLPDDPGPSPFMPSETRSYDLLGNLSESRQYSHFDFVSAFDMTMEPQSLLVTVNNHYTAAGLLDTQTSTHPTSPSANTDTKNLYDNHGILQSYTLTKGDGLGTDAFHGFTNTYTYSYAFKAGALREGGIDVESNLHNSTTTHQRNTYDGRGNLVWQRSIDGPGNREMVFFDYEGLGRVLDKATIDLLPTRQEISGDTYNSFFYNSSGEAIGNVPTSSFRRTRARLHANFGIGFTPVSPTYPSSQPSSYAVVPGDTLASIAKSFLGDAQLWYLIADANGLTTGPTDLLESQVGRSLRIPNVVTNVRNNADTFSPYNPNTIVSNTPWVGAPLPPPGPSAWEQFVQHLAPVVGMATSMVLGVTLSGLGPLGVGIAAAAGNAANQSIQIGFGRKTWGDFEGRKVGDAGLLVFVSGGLSFGLAAAANGGGMATQVFAQAGAAAATYAVHSAIQEPLPGERPGSINGWSLLTATVAGGATPVLGGLFSRLAQEALDPKTGWAWRPDARGWDAFYQQLGMGLGQVVIQDSFGSPRHNSPKPEERSQPIPPAVLEDPVDEKADLAAQAAQFKGSQEIVPAKNFSQTLVDDMEKPEIHRVWDASGRMEYQYEVDADGRMISFTDANGVTTIPEVIQVTSPPPPASSALAQFWSAVAAEQVTKEAKRLSEEAVARLLRDQGPKLKELHQQIDDWERSGFAQREAHRINWLKQQRQEILDAYDPSIPRSSQLYTPPAPFIRLPYQTSVVPLQGPREVSFPQYAPDIAPDKGGRFGKYGGLEYKFDAVRSSVGDAYAYDIETDKFQVANDLERVARAGYTEIHIATGRHGLPQGVLGRPEFKFLREDARSILETMQRNPGLRIIPYNLADPVQATKFNAMQALAADGNLPGGATLGAYCFSRTCVPDPNGNPAGPYGSVEVLEGRGALGAAYMYGGLSVGFGALSVYDGLQDPNRVVGALKVGGGGAQVIGGASYAIGVARDSVRAVRFGARAAAVGGYITAPLALVDLYRDMGHKFDPGVEPMKGEEAVFHGIENALKLAGIMYPQAAIGALALNYGVKPVAEKTSEYLTPMFVEGISRAYDIPSQYVWGMK